MYLVLRKTEESWEKIRFASTADSFPKINKKIRRGDLFCILDAVYVSDIENHATHLWIGTDSGEAVPVPPCPYDGYTWFSRYELFSAYGLYSAIRQHLTISKKVEIVFAAIEDFVDEAADSQYLRSGLSIIRLWLSGNCSAEDVRKVLEYMKNVELTTTASSPMKAISSLCSAIVHDHRADEILGDCTYNIVREYVRDHGPVEAQEFSDIIMSKMKSRVPLSDMLTAFALKEMI